MEKLSKKAIENIKKIKEKIGNSPDIIVKGIDIYDNSIYIIYNETLSDKNIIDMFILKYISEEKLNQNKCKNPIDMLEHLKENIPIHKSSNIDNFDDLFYNLLSGFSIIIVDGNNEALTLETKIQLNSAIGEAKNEMIIKGPKDAFTENYQINIGLIRRRTKTEDLWLEEYIIGTKSKTKVGIMYVKGIANQELVDKIIEKVKKINIDSVPDSNYIIELMSENKKSVFANYMSTERPDRTSTLLLDGKIAIIVENTQYVAIVPATFLDFFQSTEDLYQKVKNVNFTRIVRLIAFLIAVIGPAIYIAITTYNLEAIPEKLVMNLSTQREGVPFPTIMETLMMMVIFEILRETDSRLPNAIGSSLSIVGAIVLGQAAVSAGIVSPITIIVVSATAISGMITSNMDMVQGIRWWRFIFIIFAAFFGLFGVVIAGLLFMISTCSIKSFGVPFMAPIFPFIKDKQQNSIFLTNKFKFRKRDTLTAEGDNTRTGESKI